MKSFLIKIAFLSLLLLFSFSLSSQQLTVFAPGEGSPVIVRYYDGKEMQQFVVPDVNENPVIKYNGTDGIYEFDLSFLEDDGINNPSIVRDEIPNLIDPGVPLEGDLPTAIEYSKDGSYFAVVYQNSDNVIFYDASTFAILASVQVGRQPLDIKLGTDYAYVCCHMGQALYIISLGDFSLSDYIPVDGQPCQVELDPDQDTAFVACATFTQGSLIKIDLETHQAVYQGLPLFHHYGWITSLGRTFYKFTKFVLSPDGNQLIAGWNGRPAVFNAHTGSPIETLMIGRWCGAAYSIGGDTLYVYSNDDDTVKMFRYHAADLTVIDSICITASCWLGITDYADLSFNSDSTKVLVADSFNGRYCLFDFNTHSCQFIPATEMVMDDPLISSSDGEYAVSAAGMHVNFIDFNSGQVISTYDTYPHLNLQLPLCVSPVVNTLVVGNLNFYDGEVNYNETLYSINFKNIDNIIVDTALICGQLPEADVPVEASISDDGEKLLVANHLTHNLSSINTTNDLVDTIVSYNFMSGVIAVPGKNQALVYGQYAGTLKIISLDTYEVLKELPIPNVRDAFVTSDGQYGYSVEYIGGQWARINKIVIDGAASYVQHFTTTSGCSCTLEIFNREVTYKTSSTLSPDEKLLLVGASDPNFGLVVNIIDAETLNLLASVPSTSQCIMDFAFTEDSKRVIAIGLGTSQVPIIYLDGGNSFLEHVVNIGQKSYSAAYNAINGNFYVLGDKNNLHIINPVTGEIVNVQVINYDLNLRIRFDQRGLAMVLTTNSLIYDRETYAMPGVSTKLMYDEINDLFIIPIPGPDIICVFDPKMVGIQQYKPGINNEVNIYPNPATGQIIVTSQGKIYRAEIYNLAGAHVYSGNFNERDIRIPVGGLAHGVYTVNITTASGHYSRKFIIRP